MNEESLTQSTHMPRVVMGKVISKKMQKTIVVAVERKIKHQQYGKYVTKTTKLFAHDEDDKCNEGDMVTIKQCRPISKKKHWQLVQILGDRKEINI